MGKQKRPNRSQIRRSTLPLLEQLEARLVLSSGTTLPNPLIAPQAAQLASSHSNPTAPVQLPVDTNNVAKIEKNAPLLEYPVVSKLPVSATPTYVVLNKTALSVKNNGSKGAQSNYFGAPYGQGYAPYQLQTAYGFNQLSFLNGNFNNAGAGQTIAIIDAFDDPNIASDLQGFDEALNIGGPSNDPTDLSFFSKVNQDIQSGPLPSPDNGWAVEISLDVEWAHAMAPSAKIMLVETNDNSYVNLFTGVQNAANTNGVSVVSMSFGGGEDQGIEQTYDSYFTTPPGHLDGNGNPGGVTFVASTGDGGAPGGYPALSPNVIGAGGTTLNLNSDNTISSETGWSGSGGGISQFEPQPVYQNGIQQDLINEGNPSNGYRTIPDVSLDADPSTGEGILDTYQNPYGNVNGWTQIGGTSASAPQWASIIAIADQYLVSKGKATLDGPTQTLPALYSIYASKPNAYNDITSGYNGYSAGPGYDLVTGIGTPVIQNLIPDFDPDLAVASTVPAANSFVNTPPTSFTINFSDPIDPTSIDQSGFTVDGVVSDLPYTYTSNSITLNYSSSPVTSQGPQTIAVADDAVERLADGNPVGAFSDTFYYGVLQLAVVSSNPASGGIIDLPGDLILTFNQEVNPTSISTSNITLNEGTVMNAALVSGTTNEVDYTISGPGSLNGTTLNVGLAYGALTDTYGNPVLAFSTSLLVNPTGANHLVITKTPGTTNLASLIAGAQGSSGLNSRYLPGLAEDSNGNLYGTTSGGGDFNDGTIYEVPAGTNTLITLVSFDGTNYGANPISGVIVDSSGNLYGTTTTGGPGGYGTIFEYSSGTLSVLASFNGSNGSVATGLTLDSNGNLFGTTQNGGSGYGNIYELSYSPGYATSTITDIGDFNGSNGYLPLSGVTIDSSGDLFGTTVNGGSYGVGNIYELPYSPGYASSTINNLYSFTDGSDGAFPVGKPTLDSIGNLYGTTNGGGAYGVGTVWELTNSNTLNTLLSFNGNNGGYPWAGVTLDSSGNIYGTDPGFGPFGSGTVFEIAAGTGVASTLAAFDGVIGSLPFAGVTLDSTTNTLYGVTLTGGANGTGTVYALPVPSLSNLAIAGQPLNIQVSVEDAAGDVVTDSSAPVTISITNQPFGALPPGGTFTQNAVNGVATFSDLVLDTGGNYTLTVTDTPDGLFPTSTGILVNASQASQLVIDQTPGTTNVGQNLSPALQVLVEDQFGNLVTTSSAAITVSVNSGPDDFASGTLTVNAVGGVATFSDLVLDTPGTYTLTLSDTADGLSSATTGDIIVNPILVVTQTPGTTTAGTALTPSFQVSVEDGYGNVVTSSTAPVSVYVAYGPGGFASGTLTENAIGGVATFSDLVLDTAGNYTLAATDYADGLTTVLSGNFTVTAATASQLKIVQSPGSNLAGLAPFGGSNGYEAFGGVVRDANGDLFGTTLNGGSYGDGTVYEIAAGSTTITTLASFNGANGATPYATVTLDSYGDLFGTAFNGGAFGYGVVFEIVAGSNTITPLASFDGGNGANPYARVILDSAGDLYGTTANGGANNAGTVFEVVKGSGFITTVATFDVNSSGGSAYPLGILLDGQGNIFGVTNYGGDSSDGTVFEVVNGSGVITTLVEFNGTNGAYPNDLIIDGNGDLFSTTTNGGYANDGVVFEVVNNGGGNYVLNTLATFDGFTASQGNGPLTIDPSTGDLFGSTFYGGSTGNGVIFELTPGSTFVTPLASFDYFNTGGYPSGVLSLDSNGDLFGGTEFGGANNGGTAFELVAGATTITPIASFNESHGYNTVGSSLVEDASGNLYGTTVNGGVYGQGTIFELLKGSNTINTLASFNYSNGAYPQWGVVFDSAGNLYGTTLAGGAYGAGTVFELAKGSNTITDLDSFTPTSFFYAYAGPLTIDKAGDLFGTTQGEGDAGVGSIFEVVAGSNTITTLASFDYFNTGGYPIGGVTLDSAGNLYGTAYEGGAYYAGTVFELINGSSTITTLASFDYYNTGDYPYAGVALDSQGNLYGTTNEGGAYGVGTVYEVVNNSGVITPLASFDYYNTGGYPEGGVVLDSSGDLFGATYEGGPNFDGTVYEVVNGSNTITTIAPFDYYNTGGYAEANLFLDNLGNLYGNTTGGGANYGGAIFTLESPVAGQILTPSLQVAVEDQFGNLVTDSTALVTVTPNGPGPFASGTVPEQAVGGVATFPDLVLDKAGVYTLTASDTADSLTPDTTSSFTVTPAAASQVVIAQAPTTGTAGQALGTIQADVEDQYGNLVTSSSAPITITVATGPAGFTSGTLTVKAVNGVASFTDLVLGTAANYTLTASDTTDGLTAATTGSITVNAALAVVNTYNATVLQNVSTGVLKLALFSQVGGSTNPADYVATVQWGDGKTSSSNCANPSVSICISGGNVTVKGSHTYTSGGLEYPIVTLTYKGASAATASHVTIDVATDNTSHISTSSTAIYRNPISKLYTSTLTVKNTGTTTLSGEFALVLQGLTAGVTLKSALITVGGMTYSLTIKTTSAGDPMIIIPESLMSTLGAGKSFQIGLSFADPANSLIKYNTKLYSDPYASF